MFFETITKIQLKDMINLFNFSIEETDAEAGTGNKFMIR